MALLSSFVPMLVLCLLVRVDEKAGEVAWSMCCVAVRDLLRFSGGSGGCSIGVIPGGGCRSLLLFIGFFGDIISYGDGLGEPWMRYGLLTVISEGVVVSLPLWLQCFSGLLIQLGWSSVVPLLLPPLKKEGISYSVRRGRLARSTILTRLDFGSLFEVASKIMMAFYGSTSSVEVGSAPVPTTQPGYGDRRRKTGVLSTRTCRRGEEKQSTHELRGRLAHHPERTTARALWWSKHHCSTLLRGNHRQCSRQKGTNVNISLDSERYTAAHLDGDQHAACFQGPDRPNHTTTSPVTQKAFQFQPNPSYSAVILSQFTASQPLGMPKAAFFLLAAASGNYKNCSTNGNSKGPRLEYSMRGLLS